MRPTLLPGRIAGLARSCALLLALLCCGTARAAEPIAVDERGAIELWPAVTVLQDPDGLLTLEQVLAQPQRFEAHTGTPANLGRTTDTVWLRIPLSVTAPDGVSRVLEIDYPPLNRIEVHLVQRGMTVSQAWLGNALDFSDRPLPSRSHAAPLRVPPGESELFVRIQSTSSFVLPMTLRTPSNFNAQESLGQLLNGVLIGLALCMLAYSVIHGISVREPIFLSYALMVAGNTVFLISYFGIGPQYLWPHAPQVSQQIAPLAVLAGVVGGCGFALAALQIQAVSRWGARTVRAVSWLAGLSFVAGLLGLIDYRTTQALASTLGPLFTVAVLPVALLRAWRGERVAAYVVFGWACYAVGAVSVSGLLRGHFEPTVLTRHLFPVGALVEMAVWMVVLGMRVQTIHRNADRARIETDALRSLAHTDPLTGLPNRRGLQQHLGAALERSHRQQLLAVFLLDLDGFKPVNDRHGHDVGDALLVAVGKRLQAELRGTDIVARLGGDEFVVLASGLLDEAAAHVLGHKLLAAFDQPFNVAGRHCHVGLTVGYAIAPLDGANAEELIKRADAAMYAGKAAGRGRVERSGPLPAAA